ncbi:MAG: BMP family ABC transporter substrate-binding protein [Oscillospiraceae bacterium]|nr:BMP family ABC transporter substrate-binding protein [Oscillospiraceae bacterium]
MSNEEALEQYLTALKAGHKEYKERTAAGLDPYPAVLDAVLPPSCSDTYQDIGLVEIPAERIIGTKSAGRITAFSAGFLPLLDVNSEFAAKWMALCDAHLSPEGIRDPVLCYEYLGNFYVQEGNKRVSVLKSFGAPRIPGIVRRVLPEVSEEPHIRAYFEFLDFYKDAGIYDIRYQAPGDYSKLLSALGKEPGIQWTQWDQRTFRAYFQYFKDAFNALGGSKLSLAPEEALLVWLELYSFKDLGRLSAAALKKTLSALWKDLRVLSTEDPVQVNTEPEQDPKAGLLNRLISFTQDHINIAFIHQMDPTTSPWTRGHDKGRIHLEHALYEKVTVRNYFHADSPEETDALLEQAVAEGAELVFTTTPRLSRATLKAAVKHPKVRFFNCSVNVPYSSLQSYYCRIYEGKFITGAIAGAMANNDRIGYIASYPIYGVPASINAFALGAQMTNPRAQIDLRWSCLPGDPVTDFIRKGYQVISNRDVPTVEKKYLQFGEYGTYFVEEDQTLLPLGSPCWLWGTFYEKVVNSILNGTWEHGKHTQKAMNYWWGMDSGVIDVELSERLPDSMRYLADVLRQGLRQGTLDPFHRRIVAQDGTVVNDGSRHFTPDEVLHMQWLCENVDGAIPEFDEVLPFAQPMLRELGIYKELIPPEKEAEVL